MLCLKKNRKGKIKYVGPGGLHASLTFIDQQRSIWLTVISNGFKDKKPKQTGPEALIHTKRLHVIFSKCALIGG